MAAPRVLARFRRAALALLALASAPQAAEASPQDLFGFGSRSPALGGTGAASSLGGEATYANPALLSLGRERELTLGLQEGYFRLHARGAHLPGDMHPEPMRGTLLTALLPVPFGGVLRDRVALGLGVYTPTNVVVRGRVLYPETPQFSLLTDRVQSVAAQAGIGLDLGHGLRVGAAFSALAAISGGVQVGIDNSGAVGTKVDDQLVASYGKILGASLDLGPHYRVGVTYRSRLEARFSVLVTVSDLGSLVVPPLNIAGLAQFDPWQVQVEIARVGAGRLRAAVGVTFKHWSSYPGGPEATVLCPDTRPDCKAPVPPAPGFHDTLVPRLGVEADLAAGPGWAMVARAGYFFEPSPAPEQTGAANGFDNSRHALTLGYGLALREPLPPLRLDWFVQLHQLVGRTHTKGPDVADGAQGTPDATTGGQVIAGGLALSVAF